MLFSRCRMVCLCSLFVSAARLPNAQASCTLDSPPWSLNAADASDVCATVVSVLKVTENNTGVEKTSVRTDVRSALTAQETTQGTGSVMWGYASGGSANSVFVRSDGLFATAQGVYYPQGFVDSTVERYVYSYHVPTSEEDTGYEPISLRIVYGLMQDVVDTGINLFVDGERIIDNPATNMSGEIVTPLSSLHRLLLQAGTGTVGTPGRKGARGKVVWSIDGFLPGKREADPLQSDAQSPLDEEGGIPVEVLGAFDVGPDPPIWPIQLLNGNIAARFGTAESFFVPIAGDYGRIGELYFQPKHSPMAQGYLFSVSDNVITSISIPNSANSQEVFELRYGQGGDYTTTSLRAGDTLRDFDFDLAGGISWFWLRSTLQSNEPSSDPLVLGLTMANEGTALLKSWPVTLLPDFNLDRSVDAADAGVMFGNWGASGVGDLNRDGIVDAADAGALFAAWTGDIAPVPEPNSFWGSRLVTLGALSKMRVGRRRRVMANRQAELPSS